MDLSWIDILILGLAAILSGMSKSGLSGVSLISVVIFTQYFGKESVGILLPLLVIADFTVYPNFKQYGGWQPVWRLLFPVLIGLSLGFTMLNLMPDRQAKVFTGILVLLFLCLKLFKNNYEKLYNAFVYSKWMTGGSGDLVGIATSMANAAGPVSQIYLKSQSFTKNETVGIAGRLFLLVNLLKIPINYSFDFIGQDSIWLNLKLAPMVIFGVYLGKWILKWVPESLFEKIITLSCLLSALKLIMS